MPVFIEDAMLLTEEVLGYTSNPNSPRIGIENLATRDRVQSTIYQTPENPTWLTALPSTADVWKSLNSTYHAWICTLPSSTIDYVGIAAHRGLVGKQVEVKYIADGGPQTTVFGPAIITSSEPIFIIFPEVVSVDVVVVTFISDDPFDIEVGIVNVGKTVFLPRNIYVDHTPITYGRTADRLILVSDEGHYLGQMKLSSGKKSSVSMSNIPPDFFRDYIYQKFQVPSETKPFFWAWRPGDYPLECGFCWLNELMSVSNEKANGFMQIGFNMTGFTDNG